MSLRMGSRRGSPDPEDYRIANYNAIEMLSSRDGYRLAKRFFDHLDGNMNNQVVFVPPDDMIIRFANEIADMDDIDDFFNQPMIKRVVAHHVSNYGGRAHDLNINDDTEDKTLKDGIAFTSYAPEQDEFDMVIRPNLGGTTHFVLTDPTDPDNITMPIFDEPLIQGSHVYGIDGIISDKLTNGLFDVNKGGLFIFDTLLRKFSRNYDNLVKIENLQTRTLISMIKGKLPDEVDELCRTNQVLKDACNSEEFKTIRNRFKPFWLNKDHSMELIRTHQLILDQDEIRLRMTSYV